MSGLAKLIGGSERDNIEWKRDAKNRDQIRRAICALGNDLPERGRGHLIVGVQDDGSPTGLVVTDDLILTIVNLRDEARILPRPVLTVSKESLGNADCVHVTVESCCSISTPFQGRVSPISTSSCFGRPIYRRPLIQMCLPRMSESSTSSCPRWA